jgi:hypothetical protein
VALDLLHGANGDDLQQHLRLIPTDCHLGDRDASWHIADGGAADKAWRLLIGLEDLNWVIAGKLLAASGPA